MTEPTQYEMLLKEEESLLQEIYETFAELATIKANLKKVQQSLTKYNNLKVVHFNHLKN